MKRVLTLFVYALAFMAGMFVGSLIEPAHAKFQRNSGIEYDAEGTATSPVYRTEDGHTQITVYIKATTDGTAVVQRRNWDGEWNDITDAEEFTADTEDYFVLNLSATTIRVAFTDTEDAEGSYYVEFLEGGQK